MLSATFSPITSSLDELIAVCLSYLEPSTSEIEPGTTTPASKLWIAFYRVPLAIIGNAIAPKITPPETQSEQPIEADNEQQNRNGTATEPQPAKEIEPTEPANPQPEQQPQEMPAVSDATTTEPTDPPCPEDAEQHEDGRFKLTRDSYGCKVERWKHSKKGEKYSVHLIPTYGRCDCKASEIYGNCCHQKALDRQLMREKMERDRIKIESAKRVQYRVCRDGQYSLPHNEERKARKEFAEQVQWSKPSDYVRLEKIAGDEVLAILEEWTPASDQKYRSIAALASLRVPPPF